MELPNDREIEINRSDICVKKNHVVFLQPQPSKTTSLNMIETRSKQKDLEIKISSMWRLKTATLSVVVGSLGIPLKEANKYMDQIRGSPNVCELQKVSLSYFSHHPEILFHLVDTITFLFYL